MIRVLTEGDIPQALELARAMHSEAPVYNHYDFSEEKVLRLFEVFMTNPDWFAVVAEHEGKLIGFIGVVIVPVFFGNDNFIEDISFYVTPKYRGTSAALRLVKTVEAWGIERGVKLIRFGVTTGVNNASTGSFFVKLGYEQTGQLYSKLSGMGN